jgi:hypothetical protein
MILTHSVAENSHAVVNRRLARDCHFAVTPRLGGQVDNDGSGWKTVSGCHCDCGCDCHCFCRQLAADL